MHRTGSTARAASRASVIDVLRREGTVTRARLVDATGLSRATVSSLVVELLRQGLLSENSQPVDGHGRPPTTVRLNRSAGLAIGVDVGVRHLAVAVGDLALAENLIRAAHATCRYSWSTPPSRSRRRM